MLKFETLNQATQSAAGIGELAAKRRRIQEAIDALLDANASVVGLGDTEPYARVAQQLGAQN